MATTTITHLETFVIEHCYKCGIAFGLTKEKHQRCRERGDAFYCPNGHDQVYKTSELDRQKAEVQRLKESLKWEQDYASRQRDAKEATERRLSAQKGLVTRLKNRAANGVCPCCNRYFANLHRHMSNQHPDFRNEEPQVTP